MPPGGAGSSGSGGGAGGTGGGGAGGTGGGGRSARDRRSAAPVSLQAGVGLRIQPRASSSASAGRIGVGGGRVGGVGGRGGVGGGASGSAAGRGGGAAPPLSVARLEEELQLARRRATILEAELIALRTRRRQRESRALASSKTHAGASPSVARLHEQLLSLQRQREALAQKSRELQQTKRKVRPKDIHTLQRARALVEPKLTARDAEQDAAEAKLKEVQAGVDKLSQQQRDQLYRSQEARNALQRELIEERILKLELADEPDGPW
jgi:hypothetical protein